VRLLESKFIRCVLLWFAAACLLRLAYGCWWLQPFFIMVPAAIAIAAIGCVSIWRGWELFKEWREEQQ
jgi:hypothetical protein